VRIASAVLSLVALNFYPDELGEQWQRREPGNRLPDPMVMTSVLVVDDNQAVRALIKSALEKQEGLRVCAEAVDGLDAIDKARALKPDFVTLDFSMPKLDGLQAASAMRKVLPCIRIIIFTIHKSVVAAIAKKGVDAVLAKSDGIDKLIEHIHRLRVLAFQADRFTLGNSMANRVFELSLSQIVPISTM
jgi:DNA-binding NarL/FixJ family response regulator